MFDTTLSAFSFILIVVLIVVGLITQWNWAIYGAAGLGLNRSIRLFQQDRAYLRFVQNVVDEAARDEAP